MPNDDTDAPPPVGKAVKDDRQPTNPATQAEMMAFLRAPVLTHRERRPQPVKGKKAPPKRS